MKLRLLVVALLAVIGTGCATTDRSGMAGYKIKPDTQIHHGAPDAQSFYQLARFYHGQKRLDKAESAYIKAIALDGGRVDSYNALGSLYAERGDLGRAIEQFEMAARINPKSAYVQNNLGYAYFLQGRYEEAYQAVRRGLTLDTKMARGWINLGMIAKTQADDTPEARTIVAEAQTTRRIERLPQRLVARVEPEVAPALIPDLADSQAPQEVVASAAEDVPTASDEPTTLSRPEIAAEENASVRVATQSAELLTPTAAIPEAVEVPTPRAEIRAEENMADGKFVLVSSGREVVNLAAPALTAELEPSPAPVEPLALVTQPAPAESPISPPVLDQAVGVDLSDVDFEVTNANGVTGFAKKFSAQLRSENLVVKRITNHTSFEFKATVIEYQPGFADAAQALAFRTGLEAKLLPAKAPRSHSDVRIFLGRDAVEAVNTNLASKADAAS